MRLSGWGAVFPAAYWRILEQGVDTIKEIPPDRWNAGLFYDADVKAPGKAYSKYGGFLDEVSTFDGNFFGISPVEAESLDPQQRLLLEVSWEALEHAGRSPPLQAHRKRWWMTCWC